MDIPEPANTDAFPIDDSVGAWGPHGRFMVAPTAAGALDGPSFAVEDIYDVAGHPTWLASHPSPTRSSPLVDRLLGAGAQRIVERLGGCG